MPTALKYATSHEWECDVGYGEYLVGITEHAQELLGDMVFVDLPEIGTIVSAGDDCAVAESAKAASDIYAPISGEIIAVNDALESAPERVNSAPYGAKAGCSVSRRPTSVNWATCWMLAPIRLLSTSNQCDAQTLRGRFSSGDIPIPYHASIQECVAMTQTLS